MSKKRTKQQPPPPTDDRIGITVTAFCVIERMSDETGRREYAPVKLRIVDGAVDAVDLVGISVQEYQQEAYDHASAAVLRHCSALLTGEA